MPERIDNHIKICRDLMYDVAVETMAKANLRLGQDEEAYLQDSPRIKEGLFSSFSYAREV